MAEGQVAKSCVSCGVDVSAAPRVKDKQGRYLCQACLKKVQAKQRDAASRRPVAPPAPAATDSMAALLGSCKVVGGAPCAQCKAPMAAGAVICIQCGYNPKSGKSIATQVAAVGPAGEPGSDEARSFSMPGGWIVGSIGLSVLGGLVGSVLWYAVSQGLGLEIGWVAIGVGALAGLGAAMGAKDNAGLLTGLLACLVAVLSIGIAKFQIIAAEFDSIAHRPVDESFAIEMLAAAIQDEAGTSTYVVPTGRRRLGAMQTNRMSGDEAERLAREEWGEWADEERQGMLDGLREMQTELQGDPFGSKMDVLWGSIGIFDYVFAFFAIVAALGAGSAGEFSFGGD